MQRTADIQAVSGFEAFGIQFGHDPRDLTRVASKEIADSNFGQNEVATWIGWKALGL